MNKEVYRINVYRTNHLRKGFCGDYYLPAEIGCGFFGKKIDEVVDYLSSCLRKNYFGKVKLQSEVDITEQGLLGAVSLSENLLDKVREALSKKRPKTQFI